MLTRTSTGTRSARNILALRSKFVPPTLPLPPLQAARSLIGQLRIQQLSTAAASIRLGRSRQASPSHRKPAPFQTLPRRLFSATPTATMAQDYETVLKGKYPAKEHALRVADYVKSKVPNASGVLYVEGRMTKMLEDNDEPEPFRQRRYFYYLTGCPLADCHYVFDLATNKSTLFIPPIDPDSVIWSGLPVSAAEAKELYDIDDVKYTTDVNAELARLGKGSKNTVFAIQDQVLDNITFLEFDDKNFSVLKDAIERCRVVKDDYEVALTRKANDVSTIGHHAVVKAVKKAKNERELEALFLQHSVANGAKNQAYHGIFAGGRAAATLHYVANDAPLEGKLNLLLDAGTEWNCYASDITRTFPISGKFSKESRQIYDTVLRMQLETTAALKEGVVWDDIHLLAHKIAIDGLHAIGILKGDKDEILKSRTSVAFFPHGLGHYLGMDTHDVGGNPNYADTDPMFRYLRVRGQIPAGSIVTVEPGIYFCSFIIEPYLKDPVYSKFIDQAVLDKYWDVGGVRIEDNILITKDGSENLTPTIKDPDELEKIIQAS
ncbi:metallopeptidase family M24 [Colletotrichum scovillei]|uniref:Xaa-Pro aminopeptidase n=1 Tax=Colletotrichum scovillei TaxID=1209932 RepID=A0A9P7UGY1_9PEZI|nr:metallopeptidase family M24 [Colletotrichum scovillei]KAF4782858.1 metallopeptidase family M24 [Colletotrichum scovillei]KAG7052942.1 metallopeptidase family M24 [Colletotrichum scovillei]KAG7071235.1 metallopeptidase family M24 [Colletotrichum scovillei]KAG7079461.1 metallopeptidase family M24 [Colletotrichum scovillei]